MNDLRCTNWRALAVISLFIAGSVTLNSCGSRPSDSISFSETAQQSVSNAVANRIQTNTQSESKVADARAGASDSRAVIPMPQKPVLVKTAELSLRLESLDRTMVQLRQIVKSNQGDIYDLQDERLKY